jgi:uncharacterized membrane protein HdeD (DUF308 family)
MESAAMTDVPLLPRKSDIWWLFLLQSFFGLVMGIMLITEPGAPLAVLSSVLGLYWLITGVLALVKVFVDRSTPWIWSLLTGIVGVLAVLFVVRHPLLAALTVPATLAVILGIQGILIGALQFLGDYNSGRTVPLILGATNFLLGLQLLGSPMSYSRKLVTA